MNYTKTFEQNTGLTLDEIDRGDLIDFGEYGELYVCDPHHSDEYFWVTDEKSERNNSQTAGWTILKSLAQDIIFN